MKRCSLSLLYCNVKYLGIIVDKLQDIAFKVEAVVMLGLCPQTFPVSHLFGNNLIHL